MKKFLVSAFVAVCAFVGAFNSQAQDEMILPEDMLSVFVTEMNRNLPQQVEQGVVFTKIQLINNGKQMDFVINVSEEAMGITADEFIEDAKIMTTEEKREFLGPDFEEVAKMIPIPISMNFIFENGKSCRLKY